MFNFGFGFRDTFTNLKIPIRNPNDRDIHLKNSHWSPGHPDSTTILQSNFLGGHPDSSSHFQVIHKLLIPAVGLDIAFYKGDLCFHDLKFEHQEQEWNSSFECFGISIILFKYHIIGSSATSWSSVRTSQPPFHFHFNVSHLHHPLPNLIGMSSMLKDSCSTTHAVAFEDVNFSIREFLAARRSLVSHMLGSTCW